MYLKYLLVTIAAGICVFYGFLSAARLKKHEQSISSFIMFFSALKNEMAYSRRDIEQTLVYLMPLMDDRFRRFLQRVVEELNTKNVSIKKAFEIGIKGSLNSGELYIEYEDSLIILNAAVVLGTTDYQGQEQILLSAIEQLKNRLKFINEVIKIKGQLYKKLGILASTAIIIIFL